MCECHRLNNTILYFLSLKRLRCYLVLLIVVVLLSNKINDIDITLISGTSGDVVNFDKVNAFIRKERNIFVISYNVVIVSRYIIRCN